MKKNLPAIIIHAGAGPKLSTHDRELAVHKCLQTIVHQAYEKLSKGESAFAVTVFAAALLEDEPMFNAGTGSKLQIDGAARLSASLMDGSTGIFSGVINIENVKNPILVCQKLQGEKDRVISGEGAKTYARLAGFPHYDPVTEHSLNEWRIRKEKMDLDQLTELTGTIGVACADAFGKLAVATSTGGKGMEMVGRVSDSATIAGNYASKTAAVSCTGVGEELVENGLAVKIAMRVDDGQSLATAFEKTFQEFRDRKGRGGAIGVDSFGNVCVDFTTPCILHAFKTGNREYIYPMVKA